MDETTRMAEEIETGIADVGGEVPDVVGEDDDATKLKRAIERLSRLEGDTLTALKASSRAIDRAYESVGMILALKAEFNLALERLGKLEAAPKASQVPERATGLLVASADGKKRQAKRAPAPAIASTGKRTRVETVDVWVCPCGERVAWIRLFCKCGQKREASYRQTFVGDKRVDGNMKAEPKAAKAARPTPKVEVPVQAETYWTCTCGRVHSQSKTVCNGANCRKAKPVKMFGLVNGQRPVIQASVN